MASSEPSVKVLEQCQVSPPKGSVPGDVSLPLTFFDIIWLYLEPVERVFFYQFPHSTAHFLDAVLPNLKSSLSFALQHFYPLAGKLTRSPESEEQLVIRYANGDAVTLTLAECGGDFHELAGDHPRDWATVRCLVPCLPNPDDMKPLMALQVTVFPYHGISVGVVVHHCACDGSSSMHFLKAWAAACKLQGSVSLVGHSPVYDRTLIPDSAGLYTIYLREWHKAIRLLSEGSSEVASQATDMVVATFTLRREHIEKLKQWVHSKARQINTSFHCSTFVLTYAYTWVCLTKARRWPIDRTAHFVFAVDCRGRLQPPVTPAYFGNCIYGCFVEAKVGDLIEEEGVFAAAKAIGRAVRQLEEDGALKGAEGLMPRLFALAAEQPMSISGSPKFGVYDTDFGWGKPVKVQVTSIQRSGSTSLAESRNDRGVEIGVALSKLEMDEFSSHFCNDIEELMRGD